MLDQLSERLQKAVGQWGRQKEMTDENMQDALREVRRALLEADVNLRVIKAFLSRVQDAAVGQDVLKSVDPGQQLVKIVHDELVQLLGGENKPLDLTGDPNIILMLGLQGSGKTTSAGKLAKKLKKEGRQVLLVAADVYRPAAITQLITLGKQVGVPVFAFDESNPDAKDVVAIAKAGVQYAKENQLNTVIIDTAGRLQVDTEMMAELLMVERLLSPQEKLLVIDAMTGQEAVNVAEAFNTQMALTGIVVTKLDGDSRGGAALSVVEVTQKPIKLIGVSEKLEGLEMFHPDRMATRILGMGDVLSLVERAQEAINKEEAEVLEQRLRKQQFSLDDFMKMQKQMKMLGGLDQILGMLPIPGITKEMREMVAHTGESQMKRVESIIMSMTPGERDQPDSINKSRQKRIAKGCGMPEEEVTKFLAQFEQMKMIMQMMTGFSDSMKSGKMPTGLPGFGMPSRNKKKKGKGLGAGMPDFPMGGFPGGGFPGAGAGGFPGLGKMPKMPGGGFSGGKFPGGKFSK